MQKHQKFTAIIRYRATFGSAQIPVTLNLKNRVNRKMKSVQKFPLGGNTIKQGLHVYHTFKKISCITQTVGPQRAFVHRQQVAQGKTAILIIKVLEDYTMRAKHGPSR